MLKYFYLKEILPRYQSMINFRKEYTQFVFNRNTKMIKPEFRVKKKKIQKF